MKKAILIIAIIAFCYQSNAQEFKVLSSYSVSSYEHFQQNFGYGIGYDQFIKSKNKLGFTFYQSFNRSDYSYVFQSSSDGKSYFRDVKPNNQRMTFAVNYSICVAGTQKSKFYISPSVGLNNFRINETGTEKVVNETMNAYPYQSDYLYNNKVGIGLSFEYERPVISDKILISFSANPEIIFYSKFGLDGSTTPPVVGFINFHLILKYNMLKDKTTTLKNSL
jgi:hypothetical protein